MPSVVTKYVVQVCSLSTQITYADFSSTLHFVTQDKQTNWTELSPLHSFFLSTSFFFFFFDNIILAKQCIYVYMRTADNKNTDNLRICISTANHFPHLNFATLYHFFSFCSFHIRSSVAVLSCRQWLVTTHIKYAANDKKTFYRTKYKKRINTNLHTEKNSWNCFLILIDFLESQEEKIPDIAEIISALFIGNS